MGVEEGPVADDLQKPQPPQSAMQVWATATPVADQLTLVADHCHSEG